MRQAGQETGSGRTGDRQGMREAGHESGRAGWRQGRKDAGLEGGRSCPAYLLPCLPPGRQGRQDARRSEARHEGSKVSGRHSRRQARQDGGRARGRRGWAGQKGGRAGLVGGLKRSNLALPLESKRWLILRIHSSFFPL